MFNDSIYSTTIYKYVNKFKTRDSGALQIRMNSDTNIVKVNILRLTMVFQALW